MDFVVQFELTLRFETFSTLITIKGTDIRVNYLVSLQLERPIEGFLTKCARKSISAVTQEMSPQI